MQAGTILIVDDNKSVLTSLELLLEDEFEGVETASNPNSILSVLDSRPVDLVLLDMNFSAGVNTGNEGLFWLRRIREIAPELPVIMLTAYGDVELAVRALKGGAADFVLKPWDNDNLIGKIRAALRGEDYTPPDPEQRFDIALEQVRAMIREKGDRVGLAEAKKHLAWYCTGLDGAAECRARIMRAGSLDEMQTAVRALAAAQDGRLRALPPRSSGAEDPEKTGGVLQCMWDKATGSCPGFLPLSAVW